LVCPRYVYNLQQIVYFATSAPNTWCIFWQETRDIILAKVRSAFDQASDHHFGKFEITILANIRSAFWLTPDHYLGQNQITVLDKVK